MSLFISLLLLSQIWLSGAPSVWLLCLLSVSPSLSTGGVSVPTVGIGACPSSAGPSVGEWSLEMDTWLQVCSWRPRSYLVLGPSCSPSWRASAHTLLWLVCVCDAACLLCHPRPLTGSSRWLSSSSSRQPGCRSPPCLWWHVRSWGARVESVRAVTRTLVNTNSLIEDGSCGQFFLHL